MREAFEQYLKDHPEVTDRDTQFSVFRLMDNYTMNEHDAQEAFSAVPGIAAPAATEFVVTVDDSVTAESESQPAFNQRMPRR